MTTDFETNSRVRLITAPERQGRITGQIQEKSGRKRYQVDFGNEIEFIGARNLELVKGSEDRRSLLEKGVYGPVKDLRMAMTHALLSGKLADVIYSMESTNTEYYAYQFKPVINFLNSPSNGLLIADEVGLGKTIEAGLIWTEMRARFNANRLLVVAPSPLREKWKEELFGKFGIRAEICNAAQLLEKLKQNRMDPREGFAIICSLEGIRPSKHFDEKENGEFVENSSRSQLARYLSENELEASVFDCVIIDEAHYMRNPNTLSHQLGQSLREVSENLILLSATPIQLKASDLYYLLNLIDPQNFKYESAFESILKANEPIIKFSNALRAGGMTLEVYKDCLEKCISNYRLRGNRQLKYLCENLPTVEELNNTEFCERIANRVDRINLLAQVVSRTRKRFVIEHKVTRMPSAPFVEMTPMERSFYDHVTNSVRSYCAKKDLSEGLMSTIPQRQMCSSMPAAFRAWTKGLEEDLNVQSYEMGNYQEESSSEGVAPLVKNLAQSIKGIANYQELYKFDSKFNVLKDQLLSYWAEHPKKKVILFAYYKETLRYLNERLSEIGVESQILYGGLKESKQDAINRFRESPTTKILLASEVASEGVDLQFASFLINYDLPWNPMRVEQRIGRIDRIGQKEERILIQNYFYGDTLDERIYTRLFNRLDIFKNALGDIELILGEKVHELTSDLLSHKMSKEEENDAIKQTERAIAYLKLTTEELEKEATDLAAHGDYVLNQVNAAKEMKRYVQESNLWSYVYDFLTNNYPGCDFHRKDSSKIEVDIELSREARMDLREFVDRHIPSFRTKLMSPTYGEKVRCIFSNEVQATNSKFETINQHHPLIRFITHNLKSDVSHPVIAAKVDAKYAKGIPQGAYAFVTQRWNTTGAKVQEKMVYRAVSLDGIELPPDLSESLVSSAISDGRDAGDEMHGKDTSNFYDDLIFDLDDDFYDFSQHMKMENDDRIDLMIKSSQEKADEQITRFQEIISASTSKVAKQLNEGKIKRAEERLKDSLFEFEKKREVSSEQKTGIVGVIIVN